MINQKDLIYSLEDDEAIGRIIRLSLQKAGYEVESFKDSKSFLKAFEEKRPALVILDLMLPDIQGMDVLRTIRSQADSSQVQVIILSAKRMTADKVEGLDQGADDYIEKPFDILELASRVNARLRRREAETVYLFGPLKLDDKKHRVFFDEKEIALTSTEFTILKVLLWKQGEPVSREVLEKETYETEEIFESRSIDMHIAAIRKKIGDSQGKIIRTIYGIGYQIG